MPKCRDNRNRKKRIRRKEAQHAKLKRREKLAFVAIQRTHAHGIDPFEMSVVSMGASR